MDKTPNYNAKVKAILDGLGPSERVCSVTGEKWKMTEDEIGWLKHFNVPPSKCSPLTRMRIMTAMFNGGQWWYNRHPETGKPIISSVHPAVGVKVLPDKEWFQKDFSEMGMDYDSSRSFFDQLWDLRLKVPESANRDYEASDNSISVASFGDVNSYFMVASKSKNSFFGTVALDTEESAEVFNSSSITQSYQVIHCERVHSSQYVRESKDIMNCAFVFDCRNCEDCFGATNKRNKKYIFMNEQLTESEYKNRMQDIDLGRRSHKEKYLKQFDELVRKTVWPENFNEKCENCVGEYMTKATDCDYVYYADGGARHNYWVSWAIGRAEDNAYSADPANSNNTWYTAAASLCSGCKFDIWNSRCQNVEYSSFCYDCENCFGCMGLQKKKFHILNKEYTEEEYWKVLDDIKCRMLEMQEYGEFAPAKFAMGWYPESGAVKYHLADMEFGKKIGAHMFDPGEAGAFGDDLVSTDDVPDSSELPDSIDDCDEWVSKPVYDREFDRRYAFMKPEVALYKKIRVSPPTDHPVKRVRDMIWTANSGVFSETKCEKCSKEVVISVNKTYPDKRIYCQECYLQYLETNG